MSTNQQPAFRQQHNGWSQDRQQRFLEHLAEVGSVAAAARAVGMTRQSANWLRRQPQGKAFARAWDAALADAGRGIEELALERLVHGEEEVIERDGAVVEVRRRPCDVRLLLFHLKRLEDRRTARFALQAALLERQRDRQGSTPTPPDAEKAEKAEKLTAELRAMAREQQREQERGPDGEGWGEVVGEGKGEGT
ncbi:MAG: hypothetical protein RIS17_793 [Pseudomonadota bacterium]